MPAGYRTARGGGMVIVRLLLNAAGRILVVLTLLVAGAVFHGLAKTV